MYSTYGYKRTAYKDLVEKLEEKRLLARTSWKSNIKMDLKINRIGPCGQDSSG
jgi:hypothetical protein